MPLANTRQSYGSLARAFHWLVAALILTNIGLGLYAEDMPRETGAQIARLATFYSLHKTIGIAAFFVAVARILWALGQPRPGPLHPERRIETFVAEAVHWSLYAAMVVMPLSGWLYHAASEGFAPIYWPLGQSLPFVPKSTGLAELFKSVHGAAGKLLILSILAHLAGAAKHVIADRDGTFARMLTGAAPAASARPPSRLAPAAALAAWTAIIGFGLALAPPPSERGAAPTTAAAGGDWVVESGTITFSVKQMQADIQGNFTGWSAQITYDEATTTGSARVMIPLAGMTLGAVTAQAAGPEFFDIANNPTALFKADIADNSGQLEAMGTLTLKGEEVPVTLPFTLTIEGDKATMAGEVILDRRDFGIGPGFPDETTVGFPVAVKVALTAMRVRRP